MTTASVQRERFEFERVVESEGGTAEIARLIMRDATTLQRMAEETCSVQFSEAEERRREKRESAAEARIAKRAATFGARANFSGDPRGYVVKLILKSGRFNTWGGKESGYGVPST